MIKIIIIIFLYFRVIEQTAASLHPNDFDKSCLISEKEIDILIDKATNIIMSQPMLLELVPPINICGTYTGVFENCIMFNLLKSNLILLFEAKKLKCPF